MPGIACTWLQHSAGTEGACMAADSLAQPQCTSAAAGKVRRWTMCLRPGCSRRLGRKERAGGAAAAARLHTLVVRGQPRMEHLSLLGHVHAVAPGHMPRLKDACGIMLARNAML